MTSDTLMMTITELLEYLRCKLMWNWTSPSRESLVPKQTKPELWMGTAFHKALGANMVGEEWRPVLETFLKQQMAEIAQVYEERLGVPMHREEIEVLYKQAKLVRDCLENYFEYYGEVNTYHPYEPIASEIPFTIPFDHVLEGLDTPYKHVLIAGTVDGVMVDQDGGLVLIDHKSFTQKADLRDLALDHQFTGYVACFYLLTGQPVRTFVYNGINKKVPTIPKVLTGSGPTYGRLSRDKTIVTTEKTYRQAILDNNEDPNDPYYAEHLAKLRLIDRTANPFFVRYDIPVLKSNVMAWIENVEEILREVAVGPRITYNRRWEGCWDCNVRDLCDAKLRGENVEWLIDNHYRVGTYGTRDAIATLETASVFDVKSLVDHLRTAVGR
jgi:hypothetical protein